MEFSQGSQGAFQAPLGLNIASIPRPMHSSSRMQGMPAHNQKQKEAGMQQAVLQLPEQIFVAQPQCDVVMCDVPEDMMCVTPVCVTPVSATMQHMPFRGSKSPSHASTNQRTSECPGAPYVRRLQRRPSYDLADTPMVQRRGSAEMGNPPMLQRRGSNDLPPRFLRLGSKDSTPSSMPSPVNQIPSLPSTPHHAYSMVLDSLPSTPSGIGLNTAFIASTPVHREGDTIMFGQSLLEMQRSRTK
eukprot:gnl/MRDRNA2_/MRDRNA2_93160_c0_seq1.p1 gnl/MRDRNA2_/MRDRNA2_93160_c0~~gnl/MRDRNA2_/MRDRNA2_93160_c0_seq1.p1  ORF type:complete len:243 (-),score=40.97 gnl/MRDRNA2_/MRDRNA2_93160_c0_seq1:208-936(-)